MNKKLSNLALGALMLASVAGAQDNTIGTGLRYDVQKEELNNKVTAIYDKGTVGLVVTHPVASKVDDGNTFEQKTLLELTLATKSSVDENKIKRHILPANGYVSARADGNGFGMGAQWVTPKVGGENFAISGNTWVLFYPKYVGGKDDMKMIQLNIKPDAKKSKDDGALPFIAKSVVPDNVKINGTRIKKENKVTAIELLYGEKALKGKIANFGTVGKVVSKIIPDALVGSVDGDYKLKNLGADYTINF